MRTKEQFELAQRVTRLGDDALIDVVEFAALTGFSPSSIRQKKISGLPGPDLRTGRLRWRMGAVRDWIQGRSTIRKSS
jgi:predicted DNA-binding transcriptional regulator AlpA